MSMLTLPYDSLAATDCIVMCVALVLVTELGSNGRCFGQEGVMLTDIFAGTEGAVCASRPVRHCCFPFVRMAVWALITLPPNLSATVSCDHNVAKVSISGMIPLAL